MARLSIRGHVSRSRKALAYPASEFGAGAMSARRAVSVEVLLSLVALFTLALLMPAPLAAQGGEENVHLTPRTKPEPAGSETDGVELTGVESRMRPIRVDVDLVLVNVTITDPMNRLVTGLDRDHFAIFEGKERQDIRHFSSEDAPISMGIIFDMSSSMDNKIMKAREAVVEFMKLANPRDEFFMVTFSDKPELLQDFTKSIEDVQGKLVYTIPNGRTALLDAIYLGMNKMHEAKNSKKALLIISDGGDNRSRYTEREIKSMVREADVQIYAIGIFDNWFNTEEERLGSYLLGNITDATGGRTFSIQDPNDLVDVATKIGVELRNQYVIGYRPKNTAKDGSWRKIKVKLQPPKGLPPLHVYAKTGYYAPSQ